jgi:hypothetical protein
MYNLLCTENVKPKIDQGTTPFPVCISLTEERAEGRCKIAYWQVSFGNIFQLWNMICTVTNGSKADFLDLLCTAKYYISYIF